MGNSKPTKFDVEFFEDGNIYNYKLTITSTNSIYEVISENNIEVMNRNGSTATLISDRNKKYVIDVPTEQSSVRYIERNFNDKYKFINAVSKFFYCIESNVYHNSFNIDNSSVYNISRRLSKDNFSFKLTEKLLTQFDPSLVRIELKKRENNGQEQFFPTFIHKDHHNEFSIQLDQESSAIKRLYGILPLVLFVSAVGGVLVIDEFESHLHPTIVNKLLELFIDFNTNNAQLIFTTHQPLLMKNLSEEAIWLADKSSDGSNLRKITTIAENKQISRSDISNAYIDGKFD